MSITFRYNSQDEEGMILIMPMHLIAQKIDLSNQIMRDVPNSRLEFTIPFSPSRESDQHHNVDVTLKEHNVSPMRVSSAQHTTLKGQHRSVP